MGRDGKGWEGRDGRGRMGGIGGEGRGGGRKGEKKRNPGKCSSFSLMAPERSQGAASTAEYRVTPVTRKVC